MILVILYWVLAAFSAALAVLNLTAGDGFHAALGVIWILNTALFTYSAITQNQTRKIRAEIAELERKHKERWGK